MFRGSENAFNRVNRVFNLGSLNLDFIYSVAHFVTPGETISVSDRLSLVGGKGLNQSIALSRAGVDVVHIGSVGQEGNSLIRFLEENRISTTHIRISEGPSGHAIIQVTPEGENAILVYPGANHEISAEQIREALAEADPGDFLLMQNETSGLAEAIMMAKERNMRIAWNASPINENIFSIPLSSLSFLFLNEGESKTLIETDDPDQIMDWMTAHSVDMVVLTLGKSGAWFFDRKREEKTFCEAFHVKTVDTTGAGDTFTGFFLSGLLQKMEPAQILRYACGAAALSVTKKKEQLPPYQVRKKLLSF